MAQAKALAGDPSQILAEALARRAAMQPSKAGQATSAVTNALARAIAAKAGAQAVTPPQWTAPLGVGATDTIGPFPAVVSPAAI